MHPQFSAYFNSKLTLITLIYFSFQKNKIMIIKVFLCIKSEDKVFVSIFPCSIYFLIRCMNFEMVVVLIGSVYPTRPTFITNMTSDIPTSVRFEL